MGALGVSLGIARPWEEILSGERVERRLAAILAADVAGYRLQPADGAGRGGDLAPQAASAPIDRREGRGAQGSHRQDHQRRDAKPNGLKEHPTIKADSSGYAPQLAFEFRFGRFFPMVWSPEPS